MKEWHTLKTISSPENTEIIDYFNAKYITGTYMKTGTDKNLKIKQNKPIIPIKLGMFTRSQ